MMSTYSHLVLIFAVIVLFYNPQVFAMSCKVAPSEYAYGHLSVTRSELPNANCVKYNPSIVSVTAEYIHCNGTQLRLTDTDLGPNDYSSTRHYVWRAGSSSSQLLFLFHTQVNLTTITVHYYSDHDRSLPRLRFYVVPDVFDIWDAPTARYSYVEVDAVSSGEEPAGKRNIVIKFHFTTRKVLMFKYGSGTSFAVSEIEYFTCIETVTTHRITSFTTLTNIVQDTTAPPFSSKEGMPQRGTYQNTTTTPYYDSDTTQLSANISVSPTRITLSLIATVLILVAAALILTVVLGVMFWHKTRFHKLEIDPKFEKQDLSYFTLNRDNKEQTQPETPAELYDQIQLSPSTGQSEPISHKESENENIGVSLSQHMKVSKVSETTSELLDTEKTNLDDFTYAVVDKTKKKNRRQIKQQSTSRKHTHDKIPEGLNVTVSEEKPKDPSIENLEEMYSVVLKKPKKSEEQETAPPLPSYTIESLYTAVQKCK